MRICDLNNFYSPTGGGVRTYHERKLDYFAGRSEDTYALIVPGERHHVQRRGAAQIIEVPARAVGGDGYRAITRGRTIARLFADFAPDLVEIGSPYLMPRLVHRALAQSLAPRVATVGFVHADYPDTYVEPALRGRLFNGLLRPLAGPLTRLARRHMAQTYRRMSATFGASEHVLQKLSRIEVRRLFHTPLGVEIDQFTPAKRDLERRRQIGIADDERLVLFLGRLSPEKGIDLLLDAWPRLQPRLRSRADRGPRLRLLIAGHGPREAEVAALVRRDPTILRMPHVDGRGEVASWMASADLFLSLGAFETFSLTTLEALACATPVLAADDGGAAELIRRLGAGATFARADADALAEAILERPPWSAEEAGRVRAQIEAEFTWDAACARIRAAYEQVAQAHAARDLARLEPPGAWWPAGTSATSAQSR